MSNLPMYVNCNEQKIVHCDYYIHHKCPESCGFALDIKGRNIGIGAIQDHGLLKKLRDKNDK